jgi:hypothetical protein
MPNVLNNLAADIYKAADIVGRELVGVVPSSTINGGSEGAAVGDTVRSAFTRTPTVGTITPSMTLPEGTDQTVDNKTLVINQTASVKIPWTGEEIKHLRNGAGYETVYGDMVAQAIRVIANQIESYTWGVVRAGASRAFGTAGTTPFATNFNEVAEIRQILVDNGMPIDGQTSLVLNTTAGTRLRNLANLQQVYAAGNDTLLRQGTLLNLQGLMMKESAAPVSVAKGTGASYTSNTAGYAVGSTNITLITGTGTVLAGDTVTFAGDTNRYVVSVGLSAPGVLTLAAPGLRQPLGASAVAMTVGNNATANVALHKAAAEVVIRPYALPEGGDAAVDQMTIVDPNSGLSFDISAYKGYKKSMFDISCVYDARVWKPEFVAQLLG